MDLATPESAFPKLTPAEINLIRPAAQHVELGDNQIVFASGDRDIDFFVLEEGLVQIINPANHDKEVALHRPGEFLGDIDLLTRRAVIVTARTQGPARLLKVPGKDFRKLLTTLPRLGEKLLIAFTQRRELLERAGVAGLRVIGEANCADTTLVREFLYKNFVPYTWYDADKPDGKALLSELAPGETRLPVIECRQGEGGVLVRPTLHDVAECAGIVRPCPDRIYDLAIVGAGPAGLAASVYAASEGLSTVVIDRLGPGGQASGSSMIENFIGFPSGLSGSELAARGVLQMLKFGALLLTPVSARSFTPGKDFHTLHTTDADIRARVVLAATGARWRKLDAKGAARFERNGIYYSATTVEQRLCISKPIAVIGAGNSGGQAAMYLSECAEKVHYLIRGPEFGPGMSAYLVDRIKANPKIEVLTDTEVTEVLGDPAGELLTGIETRDKHSGQSRRLDVSALFVFIGAEPLTEWLPSEAARDDKGYLLTGPDAHASPLWPLKDRSPCPLETTIPRVLAAGDLRHGSTKRVGFAVGDGSLAITCVHSLRHT